MLGKPVGGGMPCAVDGFSAALAERAQQAKRDAPAGHSGIGTTVAANLPAASAIRATLADVMTDAARATMFRTAARRQTRLEAAIAQRGLPWCVTRIGARTEFQFSPTPPDCGSTTNSDRSSLSTC